MTTNANDIVLFAFETPTSNVALGDDAVNRGTVQDENAVLPTILVYDPTAMPVVLPTVRVGITTSTDANTAARRSVDRSDPFAMPLRPATAPNAPLNDAPMWRTIAAKVLSQDAPLLPRAPASAPMILLDAPQPNRPKASSLAENTAEPPYPYTAFPAVTYWPLYEQPQQQTSNRKLLSENAVEPAYPYTQTTISSAITGVLENPLSISSMVVYDMTAMPVFKPAVAGTSTPSRWFTETPNAVLPFAMRRQQPGSFVFAIPDDILLPATDEQVFRKTIRAAVIAFDAMAMPVLRPAVPIIVAPTLLLDQSEQGRRPRRMMNTGDPEANPLFVTVPPTPPPADELPHHLPFLATMGQLKSF